MTGEAAAALTTSQPEKFGQALILQLLPGTWFVFISDQFSDLRRFDERYECYHWFGILDCRNTSSLYRFILWDCLRESGFCRDSNFGEKPEHFFKGDAWAGNGGNVRVLGSVISFLLLGQI